ncbi:uncharacterized protein LOC132752006 [Ruditapes philippinarum]|uniref:uncharacterized protein LOC132752006 n=1 Tax=Ruditapes philippinarum TaxID=129788 RepID=UPI00295B1189|nr:uncharacterized protein LOC132752006 [Ruditapes philippinarum]
MYASGVAKPLQACPSDRLQKLLNFSQYEDVLKKVDVEGLFLQLNEDGQGRTASDLWSLVRTYFIKRKRFKVIGRFQDIVRQVHFRILSQRDKYLAQSVTQLDVLDVSLQLAKESRRLFLALSSSDIEEFTRSQGKEIRLSIENILRFNEDLRKMVITEVLKTRSLSGSIYVLKFFIQVGLKLLYQLHDFSSFIAIVRGLTSLPLYHLDWIWLALFIQDPFTFCHFLAIRPFQHPEKQHAAYTSRVTTCLKRKEAFVPLLDHILEHCLGKAKHQQSSVSTNLVEMKRNTSSMPSINILLESQNKRSVTDIPDSSHNKLIRALNSKTNVSEVYSTISPKKEMASYYTQIQSKHDVPNDQGAHRKGMKQLVSSFIDCSPELNTHDIDRNTYGKRVPALKVNNIVNNGGIVCENQDRANDSEVKYKRSSSVDNNNTFKVKDNISDTRQKIKRSSRENYTRSNIGNRYVESYEGSLYSIQLFLGRYAKQLKMYPQLLHYMDHRISKIREEANISDTSQKIKRSSRENYTRSNIGNRYSYEGSLYSIQLFLERYAKQLKMYPQLLHYMDDRISKIREEANISDTSQKIKRTSRENDTRSNIGNRYVKSDEGSLYSIQLFLVRYEKQLKMYSQLLHNTDHRISKIGEEAVKRFKSDEAVGKRIAIIEERRDKSQVSVFTDSGTQFEDRIEIEPCTEMLTFMQRPSKTKPRNTFIAKFMKVFGKEKTPGTLQGFQDNIDEIAEILNSFETNEFKEDVSISSFDQSYEESSLLQESVTESEPLTTPSLSEESNMSVAAFSSTIDEADSKFQVVEEDAIQQQVQTEQAVTKPFYKIDESMIKNDNSKAKNTSVTMLETEDNEKMTVRDKSKYDTRVTNLCNGVNSNIDLAFLHRTYSYIPEIIKRDGRKSKLEESLISGYHENENTTFEQLKNNKLCGLEKKKSIVLDLLSPDEEYNCDGHGKAGPSKNFSKLTEFVRKFFKHKQSTNNSKETSLLQESVTESEPLTTPFLSEESNMSVAAFSSTIDKADSKFQVVVQQQVQMEQAVTKPFYKIDESMINNVNSKAKNRSVTMLETEDNEKMTVRDKSKYDTRVTNLCNGVNSNIDLAFLHRTYSYIPEIIERDGRKSKLEESLISGYHENENTTFEQLKNNKLCELEQKKSIVLDLLSPDEEYNGHGKAGPSNNFSKLTKFVRKLESTNNSNVEKLKGSGSKVCERKSLAQNITDIGIDSPANMSCDNSNQNSQLKYFTHDDEIEYGRHEESDTSINQSHNNNGTLVIYGSDQSSCSLCHDKECLYQYSVGSYIQEAQINLLKVRIQSCQRVKDFLKSVFTINSYLTDFDLLQLSLKSG